MLVRCRDGTLLAGHGLVIEDPELARAVDHLLRVSPDRQGSLLSVFSGGVLMRARRIIKSRQLTGTLKEPSVPGDGRMADIDPCRVRLLWLEITDRCEEACHYCYAGARRVARGQLSLRDVQEVLERVAGELAVERVQITGGDPSAHAHYSQIVEAAATTMETVRLETYVNPFTWTGAHWDTLARFGVRARITFHRRLVAKVLGPGNLDAALAPAVQRGIGLYVTLLADILRVAELKELSGRLRERGISYRIVQLKPAGSGPRSGSYTSFERVEHCDRWRDTGASTDAEPCLSHTLAVTSQGALTPCPFVRDYHYGHIQNRNEATAYSGPRAMQVRRLTLSAVEPCSGCAQRTDCRDCRALSWLVARRWDKQVVPSSGPPSR